MNTIFVALLSYNRPDGVIQRIDEIINQEYKDWKLFIFDDHSTEENFFKIEEYYKKCNNQKIQLYRNEKNIGVVNQINKSIKVFLETDNCLFFTWISDDNFYFPYFLKSLIKPIKNKLRFSHNLSKKNIFSYTGYELMEYKGNNLVKHLKIKKEYKSFSDLKKKFFGLACFMWSKNLINKIGFYNKEYETCEDLEYLYRTFIQTKPIERFYNNILGCVYVNHDNNIYTTEKNKINKVRDELNKNY